MHEAASAPGGVPLIDIAPLGRDDRDGQRQVARSIHRAATEIGFFYVKGHSIPQDLIDATHLAAKYFFALPEEIKRSIRVTERTAHRGYMPPAQTRQPGAPRPDNKESFIFAYPFTHDHPAMRDGHPLVGVNQWLAGEVKWQRVLERYYDGMRELGARLLGAVALSLGLDRHHFDSLYRHPLTRTRLFRYPATAGGSEEIPGAAAHTDYGALTLLWQDDVGGLQVRTRDGRWIEAPCIDGTFVVNIGDMLQRWTNDTFVSTPHRVVNDSGRERFSIATFYDPDHDALVRCLPSCSTPQNPPRYQPILAGDYIVERLNRTYAYRQPARAWQ